jgi:hypothetical protein
VWQCGGLCPQTLQMLITSMSIYVQEHSRSNTYGPWVMVITCQAEEMSPEEMSPEEMDSWVV